MAYQCVGCEARKKGDYTKGHDHSKFPRLPGYLDKLVARARVLAEQEVKTLSRSQRSALNA